MRDQGQGPELGRPFVQRIVGHRYTETELVVVDVVAVVALFVFYLTFGPHKTPRIHGAGLVAFDRGADGVTALAVLLRHCLPRTTLAIVLPVTLVDLGLRSSGPEAFYLMLGLYSVVVTSARAVGRWVAGAVVALSALAVVIGGGSIEASSVTGVVALLLLGWLAGESVRTSRAYARHRSDLVAERAADVAARQAAEIEGAIAEERVKIARELHDVVAHAMSVIAVRSGAARMVIDTQPQQAREALSIIETTTRRTLHEMRLLVGMLRDGDDNGPELRPAPGVDDVARLVEEIELAGVAVDLQLSGEPRPLPPAVDLSAYRIIQEALTNVVRHAGPTTAHVGITYRPDVIEIAVTDDGAAPGASTAPAAHQGRGHGIIGMRERTALFGGTFHVAPSERGYRLEASLRTDG